MPTMQSQDYYLKNEDKILSNFGGTIIGFPWDHTHTIDELEKGFVNNLKSTFIWNYRNKIEVQRVTFSEMKSQLSWMTKSVYANIHMTKIGGKRLKILTFLYNTPLH